MEWIAFYWPYLLGLFITGMVVTAIVEIIPPGWFPGDCLIEKLGRRKQRRLPNSGKEAMND